MTDSIGWGDGDVDPSRRVRRIPRIPGIVVWPAVAILVAAVTLLPQIRSHLADRSAAWLQRQWQTAAAYDRSRQLLVSDAIAHAAAGDEGLFASVVQALDREEAQRLDAIAHAIGRHRAWATDIGDAQLAARHALAAQVRDLTEESTRRPTALTITYYLPVASGATLHLIDAANRLVSDCVQRHHVRHQDVGDLRLTAAAAPLSELEHVTNRPLPTRLVVEDGANVDVWDLRDGTVQRQLSTVPIDDFAVLLPRVGRSVLIRSVGRWVLVPADPAQRPVTLPPADNYLTAAGDGVWQVIANRVRRFDVDGRPRGPAHTIPRGLNPPFVATADAVVLASADSAEGVIPVVWSPSDNRLRQLPGACDAGPTGAAHAIAYRDCDDPRSVLLMDTRTGRLTRLHTPRGLVVPTTSAVLPSPDARRLVVEVAAPTVDDPALWHLVVFDVATRHATIVEEAASPLAWSLDDSVLVVVTDLAASTPTYVPLAYWITGASTLAPIRIPMIEASTVVTTLPVP